MRKTQIGDVRIIQGVYDTVWVSRRSFISGKLHTMCFGGVSMDQIVRWFQGKSTKLIQDEFPHLSDAEREFLLSGATDAEWNETFKDEDEDSRGE